MVIAIQHCKYTENFSIVHFKQVNFILYKFYLIKLFHHSLTNQEEDIIERILAQESEIWETSKTEMEESWVEWV